MLSFVVAGICTYYSYCTCIYSCGLEIQMDLHQVGLLYAVTT